MNLSYFHNLLISKKQKRIHLKSITWDTYTSSIPQLSESQLKNSRIVSNRVEMLKLLPSRGYVAELGVEYGDFSQQIINILKPKKLVLVDIIQTNELNKKLTTPLFKNTTFIQGDSTVVLSEFPDEYFDFIYIDTSHTYDQTKRELEMARIKVKQDGYIGGHDYILYSYVEDRGYGVIQAVHEFCKKYRWKLKFLTNETHGYHSYIIERM